MTTTDLYVSTTGSDSNSGTQTSPFKTILAASKAASTGNGGAGVGQDNYNGAVDQSTIGNIIYNIGPDGAYSAPGAHGLYQNTPGVVENNVIYNIDGLGISTWHGAKNISIINNTIDGARDGGILVGSGDSGVGSGTGDGFTVANNIVTNSLFGIEEQGQTGIH